MTIAKQIPGTVAKLTDKQKAELSEIVDSVICGADVLSYDSVDDMLEEIISEIEASRDLTSDEHTYVSELIEEYWAEHGGDDDREEDDDDEE